MLTKNVPTGNKAHLIKIELKTQTVKSETPSAASVFVPLVQTSEIRVKKACIVNQKLGNDRQETHSDSYTGRHVQGGTCEGTKENTGFDRSEGFPIEEQLGGQTSSHEADRFFFKVLLVALKLFQQEMQRKMFFFFYKASELFIRLLFLFFSGSLQLRCESKPFE